MVPEHFSAAIVERCLTLLDDLLPVVQGAEADGHQLTTTFLLSIAMPLITIPMERLLKVIDGAPQDDRSINERLSDDLRQEFAKSFGQSQFRGDGTWYLAEQPAPLPFPSRWSEPLTKSLTASQSALTAQNVSTAKILTILRNALAHGAVAYLTGDGHAATGKVVERLAFISIKGDPRKRKSYFILSTSEQDFLKLLRAWGPWLQNGWEPTLDSPIAATTRVSE